MKDHVTDDDRLIDYVCGELDPENKTQLEAEMAQNPQLRQEADRLKGAVKAIGDIAQELPPRHFDSRLWLKLDPGIKADRANGGQRSHRRHVLLRWAPLGAAAAAIIAFALVRQLSPSQGIIASVAWGDVVRAMNRVDHFHATAVVEDPQASDPERRMFKIDLYYQAPDRWRGQGLNYVQLVTGGTVKLYDATQRKFVDPDEAHVRLMPPGFAAQLQKGDLLHAVLSAFFDGKPPHGEPVKSDIIAASEGIEVFDYARDARRQWARVWVLKESRLPLRMKIFQPEQNESMLVTFDYFDKQPASFFDPEHLAEVVQSKGLTKPYQILRAGAEPVNGKPTNRGQVHQLQGKYKAAKILEAMGNAEGGIMIVHTDPANVRPEGRAEALIDERYDTPTDNWGNIYLSTGGHRPVGGNWTLAYLPAPPFKRGRGKRVVTFQYAIELQVSAKGKSYSHEIIHKVLSTEDRAIGFGDANHVPTKNREKYWGPGAQRMVLERSLQQSASALEQWRYLQTQLDARGEDVELLAWAYNLLKNHGRAEQACELMANKLLPAFLHDPLEHPGTASEVSQYLQGLYQTHGIKALEPTIARLQQVQEEASSDRRKKALAHQLFQGRYARLSWLLQLPQVTKDFQTWPRPQVQRAINGRDGCVVVTVRLPPDPTGNADIPTNVWQPWDAAKSRKRLASHYDREKGHYSWLLESGAGPLVLQFEPLVLGKPGTGEVTVRTTWPLPVDLSKAETVPSAEAWWRQHVTDRSPAKPSRYSQLVRRASSSFQGGQWHEGVKLYGELLELPKDQWPEHIFHPANAHLNLYETYRRQYRYNILKARLRLGELAEVLPEVTKLQGQLPPLDPPGEDFAAMREAIQRRAQLRSLRLEAVRYLIDEGRLRDASAMLEEIAKDRPDPLKFPNRVVRVSTMSFTPRAKLMNSWREFDTVQWDVADRTDSSALTKAAGEKDP